MNETRMNARVDVRSALCVLGLCVACAFDVGPLQADGQATSGGSSGDDRGASPGDTVADEPAHDDGPEASTGDADTSTTGGPPGDCCEPSEAAGCLDPEVERCVCGLDPHCCDSSWDELCAEEVSLFGCGACSKTTDAPTACCSPATTSGCEDEVVQACVCAVNAYCCHVEWDDKCVAAVEQLGCGSCAGRPEAVECCSAQASAACDDPETSSCVCAHDPYCCQERWDEICVAGVEAYGCGACGAGTYGARGDCCAPQAGPGCGDAEAEACVCELDAFCCQVSWDELCVDDAIDLCGGCPAGDGERPE
jgi:hypothetical protein